MIYCFLLLASFFVLFNSFSLMKNVPQIEQGNVVYAFEGGRMQCQSQIDPLGKIVVLLKSLDQNTTLTFRKLESRIKSNRKDYVVALIMSVNEDALFSENSLNMKELSIVIDPVPLEKITLAGKEVYSMDNITIVVA